MKRLLMLVLVLSVLYGRAQKIEVVNQNHRLTIRWNNKERLVNGRASIQNREAVEVGSRVVNDVAILIVSVSNKTVSAADFAGIFFDDLPQSNEGVALWRYKPWNSWTKPMKLEAGSKMPEDDVQLYYWKDADGTYGVAVPLSGSGFRTTLGSNGQQWGSKAVSYAANKQVDSIPSLAIAFGPNPFELLERVYAAALQAMGKGENLRTNKQFPEPFNYIGWCTWNASDNGTKLNEALLLNAAKSFSDNKFPIGWMLVDDGWFQQKDRQLQSLLPDTRKFPDGFKPMIDQLKKQHGIKYMGVWHAFDGLWNGIDPDSELGRHYGTALFSWTQKQSPDQENAPMKTYRFIKPDSDSLNAFYNDWHRYLKQQGFDFVKVDNQSVVEKMAVNNYPIFSLSDSMHKALYRSVDKHFNGAIINCMDMTADAYLHFGTSAVARASEDYFPYKPGETYDLQKGNAAAHVLQAIYNSLYFGQMVYPDFDLFQSHNPNAVFHAIARAINNGPIYITDKIGEQKFDVLRPLIYSDGRIIRSETPLLPTEDCLFQVQDAKLFKASSMVRNAGLLGVWNAADADVVKGSVRPADVRNIQGDDFVVYEYFSNTMRRAKCNDSSPVQLNRMGYRLYYVVPVKNGFAALGLTGKYNAPATILKEEWKKNNVSLTLYEGGEFKAYSSKRPSRILVNGKQVTGYTYKDGQLTVALAESGKPIISIYW